MPYFIGFHWYDHKLWVLPQGVASGHCEKNSNLTPTFSHGNMGNFLIYGKFLMFFFIFHEKLDTLVRARFY